MMANQRISKNETRPPKGNRGNRGIAATEGPTQGSSANYRLEAHEQSAAAAKSKHAKEDQDFIDAISYRI